MVQNAGDKTKNNTHPMSGHDGAAYEEERRATMMKNKEIMKYLNIPKLVHESLAAHPPKKKKKTIHTTCLEGIETMVERPNLRPRTRGSAVQNEEELESGNSGHEHVNVPLEENDEIGDSKQKVKKVRGYTRKADIYARQNVPKLQVELNDMGQPVGGTTSPLANFIGTLVRTKGFPLAHSDWRLVCAKRKYQLWTDTQLFWDIDQGLREWVFATAAKKWREFKANLKLRLFDETKDDKELLELRDERVLDTDWKWLINYWRTPEAQVRSIIGKENRSKLSTPHTTGSKSFARIRHEMGKENGCMPRRDELFIVTHTHKNGLPHKNAVETIKRLEDVATVYPELKEKTIQEGDLYASVCGKEKKGYVRCFGLGPTPSDLGLPGAKRYTPTKVQMANEDRRRAEQQVELLNNRMDILQEEVGELKMLLVLQAAQNTNSTPHHASNTYRMNSRCEPHPFEEEAGEDDVDSEVGSYPRNKVEQTDRDMIIQNCSVQEDESGWAGRDVILYNVVHPINLPVARATVQKTNPRDTVQGEPLGLGCREVVVNFVFKKNAVLPRPYGNVVTMSDACGKSIAWPLSRMKVDKKAS